MNILFVSSEYPANKSQATGGIGTYLYILTSGLISQGHKVFLITKSKVKTKNKNMVIFRCDFGLKQLNFLKKYIRFKILNRIINFIEYPLIFSLGAFFKIKKIEKNIDIIEGNDFGGELYFYLLLRKKRRPVILRLHTPAYIIQEYNQETKNLFYQIVKKLETFCLRKADSLYSPTKSLALRITKDLDRPVNKIIPYPFKPLCSNLTIKRKNNLVLYVGKIQPKKGVFTLAEAIPEVIKVFPQTNFLFVGPDTKWQGKSVKQQLKHYSQLNNYAKNLSFSVGELPKNKLYMLYQQATIIVIPSLWENFPNVCLEAMSLKCPIIASNTGGLKEIITNGVNGLLFPPGDAHVLAKKIIALIKDKKLQKKVSVSSFKTIDNLSLSKITKATIKYYREQLVEFKF